MKKVLFTAIIFLGIICCIGVSRVIIRQWPSTIKDDEIIGSENLPFGIERDNPVPEVRHWDLGPKTFYYFNWGLKPTGGYSLESLGREGNLLKIKASAPRKDQMLIQVLTFPHLLVALPRGKYHFKVVNENGRPVPNIFTPQKPPLKLTIFLPKDQQIAKREILRDPGLKRGGKNIALIALEALFNQEEMQDYVNQGILPQRAVYSDREQKWYILLSESYEHLDPDSKNLLAQLISKTVQALTLNMTTVSIVTDPDQLP